MPNKPRPENRHREVRVEDELWRAAGEAARAEGVTRSEVMREALRALVARVDSTLAPHPPGAPDPERENG